MSGTSRSTSGTQWSAADGDPTLRSGIAATAQTRSSSSILMALPRSTL